MDYWLIQLDGDPNRVIRQPYDSDGYYCPICASFDGEIAPYDKDLGHSHEVCPDCKFQPGFDEWQMPDWNLSFDDYLMAYRINWLDGAGWKAEYLARLKRVLGVDEPKLREREDELREEWKRCWDNQIAIRRQNEINRGQASKSDSE